MYLKLCSKQQTEEGIGKQYETYVWIETKKALLYYEEST